LVAASPQGSTLLSSAPKKPRREGATNSKTTKNEKSARIIDELTPQPQISPTRTRKKESSIDYAESDNERYDDEDDTDYNGAINLDEGENEDHATGKI
jgi:hypothetical protein